MKARQAQVRQVETIETIVAQVRALRAERDSADARMMLYVMSIEDGPLMQVVLDAGCATIDQFLKSEGLCDSARYRGFREGMRRLSIDAPKAIDLGSEAVIAAAKLAPKCASEYVEAVDAWREEHGGTRPSDQSSERMVRQIDPVKIMPRALSAQNTLRTETARLSAENAELRHRIAQLERENAELRAKVSGEPKASGDGRTVHQKAGRQSAQKRRDSGAAAVG